MTRVCSKCEVSLPLTADVNRYCKDCRRTYQKEYRAKKKASRPVSVLQPGPDRCASGVSDTPETVDAAATNALTLHLDQYKRVLVCCGYKVPYLVTGNGHTWFRASSLAQSLGYATPQKAIRDHVRDDCKLSYKDLSDRVVVGCPADADYNQNIALWINIEGCKQLIASSRKAQANSLANQLGIQLLQLKKVCKEAGTLEQIQKAFHGTQMLLQYTVAAYRVDMYMPEYNIAIECDEQGHANYNAMADAERSEIISVQLGCHWIRYNPDAKDFCVLQLINDIHRLMLARVKSMARLKDTLVSRLTSPNNDTSFMLSRKVRLGLLEWRNLENAERPVVVAASALVGCSMEEFSRHVHANWKPGMNWGNFGDEWQLGFVKELSLFDLQKDGEVSKAFHWQNTVPKWSASASKKQRVT